jgi:hypothetical protein
VCENIGETPGLNELDRQDEVQENADDGTVGSDSGDILGVFCQVSMESGSVAQVGG